MIQIVSGHRFDDGLEGHGAALRMGHGLGRRGWQSFGDELKVPRAQGCKGRKRILGRNSVVRSGPLFLIEGLQNVVFFGKSLPEAKGESDLAVGKVADDFRRRPLAGRGGCAGSCPGRSSAACWRSRAMWQRESHQEDGHRETSRTDLVRSLGKSCRYRESGFSASRQLSITVLRGAGQVGNWRIGYERFWGLLCPHAIPDERSLNSL